MSKDNNELKIFKLNRIKFNELYEDALTYIKASYKSVGQHFNVASPFGQLLQVILHLGRMIFYYIEDSITGLNIRTAYRPDQVKGLAQLAGHDTSRPISARGACQIYYQDTGDYQLNGQVAYIPNKAKVVSKINGLTYTILFGAANGKITLKSGNYLEANLIQGEIKLQQATGTGQPLQSYNFAERNYKEVDQYYVNVYVNGEPWEIVKSILDLGFNQKGCIVRTGINSGLDVFFGNGSMGAIPPEGASIIIEYITTEGDNANIKIDDLRTYTDNDVWEWETEGMLQNGSSLNLNKNFKIRLTTDIIFGTYGEDLALTQLIAPHVSRSYVLASETNYNYFFKRMNMFSDIEIIRGSYTVNGTSVMELAKQQAQDEYKEALATYKEQCLTWGENSEQADEAKKLVDKKSQILQYTATKLSDNTYQDNTIYIMLVPDINKRIAKSDNYFTCSSTLFTLSQDEQENIINLINASGQRIITVENRLIEPKIAKFAVNIQAKIWENYDEEKIYTDGLEQLSNYFLNRTRKDIIPVSDIVSIFENNVPGIDSVRVNFVADPENYKIYGQRKGKPFNGIDEFGDIVLTRNIVDNNGQVIDVKDIIPLVKGNFTDEHGIEYHDGVSNTCFTEEKYAYNISFEHQKSSKIQKTLTKYTPLT